MHQDDNCDAAFYVLEDFHYISENLTLGKVSYQRA